MNLKQKQEDFCNTYIELGNATEAYRRVYNTDRMKNDTIQRESCELMKHPKIIARLAELRAPAVEKAQVTLEKHLATLAQLRDKAEALGQMSAAISAEVSIGKASGFYVEKHQVSAGVTPAQILAEVERRRARHAALEAEVLEDTEEND